MDQLAPARGREHRQPVGVVPALAPAAVGQLEHAGGAVLVDRRGHAPVLRHDAVVGAIDLAVVERVLDRHRGRAAELLEPDAAPRLLGLVTDVALVDVAADRIARRVAGAEKAVADGQLLDGQRLEKGVEPGHRHFDLFFFGVSGARPVQVDGSNSGSPPSQRPAASWVSSAILRPAISSTSSSGKPASPRPATKP